jgi:uncharacterized membrane protein YsdA (DUF1294 family)
MLSVIWWMVLLANVGAATLFAVDKRRARLGRRRVPERVLLWWVFATGWVGAWLAMNTLRHKTAKSSFRRVAVMWTVVNPFWLLAWWTWRTA